jgi:hypothetical protein
LPAGLVQPLAGKKNKKRAMKSQDFMALFQPTPTVSEETVMNRSGSSDHFIHPLGKAGDLAGCIPLMDRALARRSGNNRSSLPQGVFGCISCSGNNGLIHLADESFHFCFIHFVAQTAGLSLTISLFSGFVICHVASSCNYPIS